MNAASSGSTAAATREELVSVVIPAWLSQATIAGCLEALRHQTYARFETIVVDSSPDERTAEAAAPFPEVTFVRWRERLLPHGARNVGVERAAGKLLVFTDPDVYPRPDWLARLVATHRESGHPLVGGALACYGDGWLHLGIHLCKFGTWLPGGAPRAVDNFGTANLLVTREVFEELDGFAADRMLGDTAFSWAAAPRHRLWFEPRAIVAHHHVQGFRDFLRERFRRGIEFGHLRSDWRRHRVRRDLFFLAVTASGLRLPRILWLTARHCRRSGLLGTLALTWPVVVAGQAASLAGESVAYARRLVSGASVAAGAGTGSSSPT